MVIYFIFIYAAVRVTIARFSNLAEAEAAEAATEGV